MEFNISEKKKAVAKKMNVHLKVSDSFCCTIYDNNGMAVKEYEGYVPSFMPGVHYGDYVMLDIDLDSGQITNWNEVSKTKLKDFLENDGDGEGDD